MKKSKTSKSKMGRMTEFIDFMQRQPGELSPEFIAATYKHIDITPELWAKRKEIKAWKDAEPLPTTQIDPQMNLFP
jgi:hypothetical protein